jgi:hypothetical protein
LFLVGNFLSWRLLKCQKKIKKMRRNRDNLLM